MAKIHYRPLGTRPKKEVTRRALRVRAIREKPLKGYLHPAMFPKYNKVTSGLLALSLAAGGALTYALPPGSVQKAAQVLITQAKSLSYTK